MSRLFPALVVLAAAALAGGCGGTPDASEKRAAATHVATSPSPASAPARPAPTTAPVAAPPAVNPSAIGGAVTFEPDRAAMLVFGPATISRLLAHTLDEAPASALLYVVPTREGRVAPDAVPAAKVDGRLEAPIAVPAGKTLWIQPLSDLRGTCTWSGTR